MSTALVELCFGTWSIRDYGALHTFPRQASTPDPDTPSALHDQDAEQIARLRTGDEQTFDAIMVARFNRLASFTTSMLGDRAAAEDVVQDVFIRLWAQRASLQITSLNAYLYRAVRNAALNVAKGNAVRARLHDPVRRSVTDELEARTVHASDVDDPDPRVAIVHAALAALPERRRVALQLRYEQSLSYEEIAAVLGVSVNAAQQLVSQGIRSLRRIVAP